MSLSQHMMDEPISIGPSATVNLLEPTDPFYNIEVKNILKARQYFSRIPFITPDGEIGTEGFGVLSIINSKPIIIQDKQ